MLDEQTRGTHIHSENAVLFNNPSGPINLTRPLQRCPDCADQQFTEFQCLACGLTRKQWFRNQHNRIKRETFWIGLLLPTFAAIAVLATTLVFWVHHQTSATVFANFLSLKPTEYIPWMLVALGAFGILFWLCGLIGLRRARKIRFPE